LVEVSAHPVLAMPLATACSGTNGVAVGTLHRDARGLSSLYRALGELHVHGQRVDWGEMFRGANSSPAALPTYAFQRQRYWFQPKSGATDVTAAGLSRTAHPFLGAATSLAESDGELFTGRLSLSAHPWLADHKVFDTVVMPGTGIVELALAAGLAVGSP